jgi:hypothetical protein
VSSPAILASRHASREEGAVEDAAGKNCSASLNRKGVSVNAADRVMAACMYISPTTATAALSPQLLTGGSVMECRRLASFSALRQALRILVCVAWHHFVSGTFHSCFKGMSLKMFECDAQIYSIQELNL